MKAGFPVPVVNPVGSNRLDIEDRFVVFRHSVSDMAARFKNVSFVRGRLPEVAWAVDCVYKWLA